MPVTAALVSRPSASPDNPPGGSIVRLAKQIDDSLKKTGRFVANICTALIEREYDFCDRPKPNSMLDLSKMKESLSPDSAPAFSALDSTFRKASAAGLMMDRIC
mmetsp:Transcript_31471/g.67418  ORF Transcript_31471/g.67418 Transcript_31471/m.67418 type:complete len:104 (-) Transcript_31471:1533-1844(-)